MWSKEKHKEYQEKYYKEIQRPQRRYVGTNTKPIIAISSDDFSILNFNSVVECAKYLQCKPSGIYTILKYKNFGCTKGHTFIYKKDENELFITIQQFKLILIERKTKKYILPTTRICPGCKNEYPLDSIHFPVYHPNSENVKKHLYAYCRTCNKKRSLRYNIKTKEERKTNKFLDSKLIFQAYKALDKRKNREFNLDAEWILENIINKDCVYCGFNCNGGIDRIDNSKGHLKENCLPCCEDCNMSRSDIFTHEEFKSLGKVIREIKLNRLKENES